MYAKRIGYTWMALNTSKCRLNQLPPLRFKGLTVTGNLIIFSFFYHRYVAVNVLVTYKLTLRNVQFVLIGKLLSAVSVPGLLSSSELCSVVTALLLMSRRTNKVID